MVHEGVSCWLYYLTKLKHAVNAYCKIKKRSSRNVRRWVKKELILICFSQ
jgi:hypothetical protein